MNKNKKKSKTTKKTNPANVIRKLKRELEDKEWIIRKTDAALKALYKELEKKNEALRKLDRLKSQFVANVSHEFKNPLTIIKESMAFILDGMAGEINAKQIELLTSGKHTVDRLSRLVTNLLDLSKIESGKMDIKREMIDIIPFLDEIFLAYEIEIARKKLTLAKNIPQNIGSLWADRDKLSEVIINLLNNAIKYTPGAGTITITLTGGENEIRYAISDTGSGIPKEYYDKIFDKFERVLTEKEEGTGLGLPITKDIIELHKGKIWVESEAGRGSTFTFVLPRDFGK